MPTLTDPNTPNNPYYGRANHAHISREQSNKLFLDADIAAAVNLILSGMANASFDGNYTRSTNFGRLSSDNLTYNSDTLYKIFYRDAGGGNYYVVANNTSWWVAMITTSNPDDWTDTGSTSYTAATAENITTSSETQDGATTIAPSSNDANVSYP